MRGGHASLIASCLIALSPHALAEPSGAQKAAAEALFQEGTDLVNSGQVARACPKFAASQELDPALGTLLRLADCRDREGKSASAWALFLEAAALAGQRGESQRQDLAKQRASDLEARLSRLVLRLPDDFPEDASIALNGVSIPKASWSSPLPVDPGRSELKVRAAGYRSWEKHFDTPAGPHVTEVAVPQLAALPKVAKTPAPVADGRAPSPPRTERERPWESVGYVALGLGLVGLGVGAFLTVKAYDANSESLDHCREEDKNRCTAQGTRLREDALSYADGATVAFAVGGTLLVGGVSLVLFGPTESREGPRTNLALRGTRDGAALSLGGSF
ncbi:MAG: hypothetical protein H6718_17845 [Polyangiaceae bacterium]|nr:hypothetical protein [Myxococcales bacterium]MCB9587267.1 hypothetical protein [Polyangiaceae bacterium]